MPGWAKKILSGWLQSNTLRKGVGSTISLSTVKIGPPDSRGKKVAENPDD